MTTPATKRTLWKDTDHNSIAVDLQYQAASGHAAVLRVWLPELQPQQLAPLSQQDLNRTIANKLETMRTYAAAFSH